MQYARMDILCPHCAGNGLRVYLYENDSEYRCLNSAECAWRQPKHIASPPHHSKDIQQRLF